MSNRSYFKFWNADEDSNQELILVSDLHPKVVITYLEHYFDSRKVLVLDGYCSLKQPFFWKTALVETLKQKEVDIIKVFGDYFNYRLDDGTLYFHSETILFANDSSLALYVQKLLFSIGIKAFFQVLFLMKNGFPAFLVFKMQSG